MELILVIVLLALICFIMGIIITIIVYPIVLIVGLLMDKFYNYITGLFGRK